MNFSLPTLMLTVMMVFPVLAAEPLPPTMKKQSLTVTAAMRENARRNVERYPWAAARRDALLQRLKPWLELDEEALWKMLPSQGMPRSSPVGPVDVEPPGAEGKHLSSPRRYSRGMGRSYRYHIDPFQHPWKVQCNGSGLWYPANDFASYYESSLDNRRHFELGRGDEQFLVSQGDEGTQEWVDDGRGMEVKGVRFFPAAHYAFRLWTELIDVAHGLAELYTLTGEVAYARRAGLLLDRMADLYPQMDFTPWFKLGMEASTGESGLGRVQGCIWEAFTAQKLSLAYDWIFDALIADQALAEFSSNMAERYATGEKGSPDRIARHIEQNLLREFVVGVKDRRIRGNPGMHQYAMAAAAIALDHGVETTQLLDWLFEPDGGGLPQILIDGMSRDGLGTEAGLGYAAIPAHSLFGVAELLARYPSYQRGNLYQHYPKFRNALASGERVRVAGGANLHWGDGGRAQSIASRGFPAPLPMALKGYELRRSPENLREVLNAADHRPEAIPGDIYAAEPGAMVEEIRNAIRDFPGELWPLESFNSGGIGFAVLQSPHKENPRMVALNYGPMGRGAHGHGDRLGLHLISDGVYMATDLGYPTAAATQYPPRLGWSAHTVSHNTVMVDDQNMEIWSSFSGKTRLFAEAGPVRIMDIDGGGPDTLLGEGHSDRSSAAKPIYPQCRTYRRAVVMMDVDATRSYYIDLFWVRGGSKHRLIQNGGAPSATSDWPEWSEQKTGTLAGPKVAFGEFFDGKPRFGYMGSGFMYLDKVERARPDRPFYVDWAAVHPYAPTPGKPHFRVHNLTPLKEAALATGYPPQDGPKELRYLVRTVEKEEGDLETQFVSVMEPYNDKPFISELKVLKTEGETKGFALALEVRFHDGRSDLVLVNEEDGTLRSGQTTLKGRLGWLRRDQEGKVLQSAVIDAAELRHGETLFRPKVPVLSGKITAIDESDPDHVLLETTLEETPGRLVGQMIIVANRQRADASYRIIGVGPGGRLDIGPAALGELLAGPNESSGIIRNIAVGESFRIANAESFQSP